MSARGKQFHLPPVYQVVLLSMVLLPSTLWAQRGSNQTPDNLDRQFQTVYTTSPGTGILIVTVFSEKIGHALEHQAVLKLTNLATQAATWAPTEDHSIGAFTELAYGEYDLEISAVGFVSEHRPARIRNSEPVRMEVLLKRDPNAIKLDIDASVLPLQARKETKRAVAALKSQDYKKAETSLRDALSLAPNSSELNFLLGYLYFQQKKWDQAAHALGDATVLNPRDVQALTLLGRADLERKDSLAAQLALEKAVAEDGSTWLPHDLLASAYFQQKKYAKAKDEAQLALDKGKSEAEAARLVLGEALINLGMEEQGLQALNTFLQESPSHPMAGQVRTLISELQEHATSRRQSPDESDAALPQTGSKFTGVNLLEALPAPGLTARSWQPPSLDDLKIPVAEGVACPKETVLAETGKHVEELSEDLARFAAVEDLFHQRLDVFGNPLTTETRKYNYVAAISEPEPGFLSVDEYRSNSTSQSYPDQIASTGFAALALVFHPHMQDEFEMKCEGLGDWHGQAAWIVHFQQRDDKPNRIHSYTVGKIIHPVKLKGRAWITADGYEIAHIESEMVRPMPEIRLLSEHQIVEYGPVRFDAKKTSLWLPKRAEIYFDFRQHRYYRRHSFDHYMLFSVDSNEKATVDKKLPTQESFAK